jgi:Xaa-Pro aminopeptidase
MFDIVEYQERIRRLIEGLKLREINVAIITNWENLNYFAGIVTMYSRSRVVESMPLIVVTDVDEIFFVPTMMFCTAAKLEHSYISNIRPYVGPQPWNTVAQIIRELKLSKARIAIELNDISGKNLETLKKLLPEADFFDCTPLMKELRSVKSRRELEYIKKSCEITDRVLERTLLEILRPGKTEISVAREMIKIMIEEGAEGPSFYPQVISGHRSAFLNVSSSNKIIKNGDIVMLDFGINYNGYCSDTARPVILNAELSIEQEKACQAALEITNAVLYAVKAGVKASDIHNAAVLAAREIGYSKYLRHHTGHGIGLNVWEPPMLAEYDDTILKENMTLAVEQGVYFERFGFRFEQNVIVKRNGCEQLFKSDMTLFRI